jgi:hypothetical protein
MVFSERKRFWHRMATPRRGAEWGAELVLIDVGPNLGAISRSALIASDQVCLPLAPDLFSLQGLKNLEPTFREWRTVWAELLTKAPLDLPMPRGAMQPVGYIKSSSTLSSPPPAIGQIKLGSGKRVPIRNLFHSQVPHQTNVF